MIINDLNIPNHKFNISYFSKYHWAFYFSQHRKVSSKVLESKVSQMDNLSSTNQKNKIKFKMMYY